MEKDAFLKTVFKAAISHSDSLNREQISFPVAEIAMCERSQRYTN